MSQRGKALLAELLALPAKDRKVILQEAFRSLHDNENDDEEFQAELDRRFEEVMSGKIKAQPRSVLDKR